MSSQVALTENRVEISSLNPQKLTQLQNATVDPPMYIYIEKFDLDPVVNAVVYEIEVGIKIDNAIRVKTIRRRYSQLQQFDQEIRPLFKDCRFLLDFPPKRYFGNKDRAFLDQRADMLQKYLTNLVRVSGISTTPQFCRTFEIDQNLLNGF